MLYAKIKEVCKEKGVSVAYVEKQAGLSNGTIGKWDKVSPTIENLQAVAKTLERSVDDLLECNQPITN